MVGDGGQGVRVDDGIEVEGARRNKGLSGIDLEGVIVGGGEEGEGIEGVEGEVGDAEILAGC